MCLQLDGTQNLNMRVSPIRWYRAMHASPIRWYHAITQYLDMRVSPIRWYRAMHASPIRWYHAIILCVSNKLVHKILTCACLQLDGTAPCMRLQLNGTMQLHYYVSPISWYTKS